jgi:hypothetical protein
LLIDTGRSGGRDTWNLSFANDSIKRALSSRNDLWFIFVSTPPSIDRPRGIYIDSLYSDEDRQTFINSCDVMLYCRWEGETFGLACLEFLCSIKPIITWGQCRERNHILLADKSCIFYNDAQSLETLLTSITKDYLAYQRSFIPHETLKHLNAILLSKKLYQLIFRKLVTSV